MKSYEHSDYNFGQSLCASGERDVPCAGHSGACEPFGGQFQRAPQVEGEKGGQVHQASAREGERGRGCGEALSGARPQGGGAGGFGGYSLRKQMGKRVCGR